LRIPREEPDSVEIFSLLIIRGADPNAADDQGISAVSMIKRMSEINVRLRTEELIVFSFI